MFGVALTLAVFSRRRSCSLRSFSSIAALAFSSLSTASCCRRFFSASAAMKRSSAFCIASRWACLVNKSRRRSSSRTLSSCSFLSIAAWCLAAASTSCLARSSSSITWGCLLLSVSIGLKRSSSNSFSLAVSRHEIFKSDDCLLKSAFFDFVGFWDFVVFDSASSISRWLIISFSISSIIFVLESLTSVGITELIAGGSVGILGDLSTSTSLYSM